ncbi:MULTISPECIES: hypothetical protein [Burkholderia]|uniref:hypothetical protein n=1 Tax=Burkholderia TaxID=32008 RepID=UPI0007C6AA6E|nr:MULTISPECIES: hypothetical protein [Burkholderia]
MIKRLLLSLVVVPALFGVAGKSVAQTSPASTPTTKVLAIGTFPAGTDMQLVQHILSSEVRETAQLYLKGGIDQWYSLQDRPGVAFILNVTDTQQARTMLEDLPLGKAHLMSFEIIPLGPLNPLRQLLAVSGSH